MKGHNGLFQTWPVPLLILRSWAACVYWLHIWVGSEEDESSLIQAIEPLCCKSCFIGEKQASKSSQQTAGSHGTAHWCNYMIALVKYPFLEYGVAVGWKGGLHANLSPISEIFCFQTPLTRDGGIYLNTFSNLTAIEHNARSPPGRIAQRPPFAPYK